jgi:hypothetical protein
MRHAHLQGSKIMKIRRAFRTLPCSLLALLVAAASVSAAEESQKGSEKSLVSGATDAPKPDGKKYELRYKLNRGDVLRYDVAHRASIRTTIDDTTQAAQTKTDSVKAWKVTDVLPEGDIEITNVVEKVHMVNQLPEKDPTEYDSERDKIPPQGYEDAAKAVGVPLSTMRITPQGKMVRRDSKVRNQGAPENDAPIVLRLPENKVAIGETWDESFEVQVKGPEQSSKTIQTRRHHKLTDVKDGIATIEVTYQVLSPIDSQIEMQIVQRLMDGEARFDIEKGRLVSQQMDVDKRIIGFAGGASSMHYIMKMEEKLIPGEKVAAKTKPTTTATTSNGRQNSKTSKPAQKSTPQTANRPRNTKSNSGTIRR